MKEILPICIKHYKEVRIISNVPGDYKVYCSECNKTVEIEEIVCPACYSRLYVIISHPFLTEIFCSNVQCPLWKVYYRYPYVNVDLPVSGMREKIADICIIWRNNMVVFVGDEINGEYQNIDFIYDFKCSENYTNKLNQFAIDIFKYHNK